MMSKNVPWRASVITRRPLATTIFVTERIGVISTAAHEEDLVGDIEHRAAADPRAPKPRSQGSESLSWVMPEGWRRDRRRVEDVVAHDEHVLPLFS
jgi:hypothetical protein